MVTYLLISFLQIIILEAAPSDFTIHLNHLHNLMNEHEKHFYFGGQNEDMTDYEVTDIQQPEEENESGHKIVHFEAVGQTFQLKLWPNRDLLAPQAVVLKRTANDNGTELVGLDRGEDCHFLHKDEVTVAALSMCSDEGLHGMVMRPGMSIELMPINNRLKRMMKFWNNGTEDSDTEKNNSTGRQSKSLFNKRNFHIVKRNPYRPHTTKEIKHDQNQHEANDDLQFDKFHNKKEDQADNHQRSKRGEDERVLELAVFLDSTAYRKFSYYFESLHKPDKVETQVKRLLLSYLNGIQAIYMLPSLGHDIKLSIVRVEIWTAGYDLYDNHQGDREPLLNTFCSFQEKENPEADTDPAHWDMALLVSGLNFYAVDSHHRKNGVTMGLARVGGVCHNQHNCVIGELGVTNDRGKPYPSAGFTAVYVMAHEIGHNLGMHHDHTDFRHCAKDGFIMSASRGTKGESLWSHCSVDALQDATQEGRLVCLDDDSGKPSEHLDLEVGVLPGEVWSATRQCQIFLLDSDARVDHTTDSFPDMCTGLRCRTPNRMKAYYRAGPALEGTACGMSNWCSGGECVMRPAEVDPSPKPGEWSDWQVGGCESGCTKYPLAPGQYGNSLGFRMKKRECVHPNNRIHSVEGCQGRSSSMDFCDDGGVCGEGRLDTSQYASQHCKDFQQYVKKTLSGEGTQASYSEDRLWMACAIFCKVDHGGWYTPRLDLNDLTNLSPYFPTGTLCHQEAGTNYYCQKNMCVEEKARVGRDGSPDLNLLFNAPANPSGEAEPNQELVDFFSLDDDRKPVGGTFAGLTGIDNDEEAEVIDYIEIGGLH